MNAAAEIHSDDDDFDLIADCIGDYTSSGRSTMQMQSLNQIGSWWYAPCMHLSDNCQSDLARGLRRACIRAPPCKVRRAYTVCILQGGVPTGLFQVAVA